MQDNTRSNTVQAGGLSEKGFARDVRRRAPVPPALPGGPRLSPLEFAYLRAIAQGLDKGFAARRYLGVDHGHAVEPAHRFVIERAQAVARRRGDSRWRLLGALIPAADATGSHVPSVEDWAAAQGLSDWSWQEQVEMHAERFATAGADPRRRRLTARNARLIQRRLQLLHDLESADPKPRPSDTLDGWLAPREAALLQQRGLVTLDDLRRLIAVGGRWWSILPAYGPKKAARLAAHLGSLLGSAQPSADPLAWRLDLALDRLTALEGSPGPNRAPLQAGGIDAATDRAAIAAWLGVVARRSAATRASYQREAERFLLWLALVHGCDLASVSVAHCSAYIDFLADVPWSWHSRRGVSRFGEGWAPFRGTLKIDSQQLALTIVGSLFGWLLRAGYLSRNPWALVSIRLGDDPERSLEDPTSRAFTPAAWEALQLELDALQERHGSAAARLRWLLVFCSLTGLRISEVVRARRQHLRSSRDGWTLDVFGKGRKARVVVVPRAAVDATFVYFAARGLALETCSAATLLLAPVNEEAQRVVRKRRYREACRRAATAGVPSPAKPDLSSAEPVSYTAMRSSMCNLVARAARRLPAVERTATESATLHWLRHTFGTRAAEAGVAANDIQEQLGQADPRTAARYSRAQIQHRARALEKVSL